LNSLEDLNSVDWVQRKEMLGRFWKEEILIVSCHFVIGSPRAMTSYMTPWCETRDLFFWFRNL